VNQKSFKSLGALIVAAKGVGMHLQMIRRLHRATSVKVRHDRYLPHEGAREVARRRRQIAQGMHNVVQREE